MRNRTEIEDDNEKIVRSPLPAIDKMEIRTDLTLEVLLDIRKLLAEQQPPKITGMRRVELGGEEYLTVYTEKGSYLYSQEKPHPVSEEEKKEGQ